MIEKNWSSWEQKSGSLFGVAPPARESIRALRTSLGARPVVRVAVKGKHQLNAGYKGHKVCENVPVAEGGSRIRTPLSGGACSTFSIVLALPITIIKSEYDSLMMK